MHAAIPVFDFRFSKIPNPLNPIESKSFSFRPSSTLHPVRPIVQVAELQHRFLRDASIYGMIVKFYWQNLNEHDVGLVGIGRSYAKWSGTKFWQTAQLHPRHFLF